MNYHKNLFLHLLVFAFFVFPDFTFAQQKKKETIQNELQNAIEELNSDGEMRHASWSIAVIRVSDGRLLASHQPEIALTPASVLKLVLTYPAWIKLGKNYTFKTYLEHDSYIDKDSILHGNLYLRGSGDPTFASQRVEKWSEDSVFGRFYKTIAHAGIKIVAGTILADAQLWNSDLIPSNWLWSDIGNYYGSGACALNYHENFYTVSFQSGQKIGDKTRIVSVEPAVTELEFDNAVTTAAAGSGDQVILYGVPGDNQRLARGTVPLDNSPFKVKGSLPDPTIACVRAFHRYLTLKNIEIGNPANTLKNLSRTGNFVNHNRSLLDSIESPSLEQIIRLIHEKSINLYAESLVKTLGSLENQPGNEQKGIQIITEFWAKNGINTSALQMEDGCGLSPLNKISCFQLASMLRFMARDLKNRDFLETLNEGGQSGNLKNLFKGSTAEGNLRAKSGYMKGVRSYAGITLDKKGEELAFAIIVNNYEGSPQSMKLKLEKLMISIANSTF